MSDQDECRKTFEAWYAAKHYGHIPQREDEGYWPQYPDSTWHGWKAAWDAREKDAEDVPITARQLADAFDCFNNAALSAMHAGTHDVAAVACGIGAIAQRLIEYAAMNQRTDGER